MVMEMIDAIKSRIDFKTLTVSLPDAFENMKFSDASLEMVTSSNLQKLHVQLNARVITKSKAVIFYNSTS